MSLTRGRSTERGQVYGSDQASRPPHRRPARKPWAGGHAGRGHRRARRGRLPQRGAAPGVRRARLHPPAGRLRPTTVSPGTHRTPPSPSPRTCTGPARRPTPTGRATTRSAGSWPRPRAARCSRAGTGRRAVTSGSPTRGRGASPRGRAATSSVTRACCPPGRPPGTGSPCTPCTRPGGQGGIHPGRSRSSRSPGAAPDVRRGSASPGSRPRALPPTSSPPARSPGDTRFSPASSTPTPGARSTTRSPRAPMRRRPTSSPIPLAAGPGPAGAGVPRPAARQAAGRSPRPACCSTR